MASRMPALRKSTAYHPVGRASSPAKRVFQSPLLIFLKYPRNLNSIDNFCIFVTSMIPYSRITAIFPTALFPDGS
jgi:hypothetical protein